MKKPNAITFPATIKILHRGHAGPRDVLSTFFFYKKFTIHNSYSIDFHNNIIVFFFYTILRSD